MTVILPQNTSTQIGLKNQAASGAVPVLYLLHGLSDDHTIWLRRTSIERYVASMGLAVVMPNAHRSFYTNMVSGGAYWDFVSEELPELIAKFFNLAPERDKTFVAGLSMGGYGALKLGLRLPEKFAAVASLSGVTDIVHRAATAGWNDIPWIFGDKPIAGSTNDLFYLAEQLVRNDLPRPKIYQCCGTEDFLYQDNLKFKQHLERLQIDFTYNEAPGIHSWDFWDIHIQNVLKWLPLTS
jgi:S-formylglutathione hydrolase FrmB